MRTTKNRPFRHFVTPVIVLGLCFQLPTLANDSHHLSKKTRFSHIPAKIREMVDLGKMDIARPLSVTIALKLNNEDQLDNRVSDIYLPDSPSYHQFLTPEEFKTLYAPSAEQVQSEKTFLESQGIVVDSLSENGVLLRAHGSVGVFNQAFHTEIHRYRRHDGNTYFAPVAEIETPAESMIDSVIGLSDVSRDSFEIRHRALLDVTKIQGQEGFSPSDFRAGYAIPASATGGGQTIAVIELTGYNASDIAGYEQQFNLPNVPLQNILLDGATGQSGKNPDAQAEATMDIELIAGMAPQASKILVYESAGSSKGLLDAYARIANDNLAKQVSTSIAQPEDKIPQADAQAENTVFKQMIAQGQVLYAAAGDTGPKADGKTIGVQDPASQPYVVGVGGTRLQLTANDAYEKETTWNDQANGAGGGGISKFWSIPSWQVGAATADTQASTTMRNVPDVSLAASETPGYLVFLNRKWQSIGGTSAAAPIWAAFTALVNQERAANNLAPIGFTNPAIYAIGKGSDYTQDFNDIADGSTNGMFNAVSGYDNATGWGSFRGAGLLQSLANY
jgi:kumamolisin